MTAINVQIPSRTTVCYSFIRCVQNIFDAYFPPFSPPWKFYSNRKRRYNNVQFSGIITSKNRGGTIHSFFVGSDRGSNGSERAEESNLAKAMFPRNYEITAKPINYYRGMYKMARVASVLSLCRAWTSKEEQTRRVINAPRGPSNFRNVHETTYPTG